MTMTQADFLLRACKARSFDRLLASIGLVCLVVASLCPSHANAVDAWQSRLDGDRLVYTPSELQADETLELVVLPATTKGGQEFPVWFAETAVGIQKQLGEALAVDSQVRLDDLGRLRARNAFAHPDSGTTLRVDYRGVELDDDHFLFSYLLSHPDGAARERIASGLPRVMAEAQALRLAEVGKAMEEGRRALEQAETEEENARRARSAALRTEPGQGVQDGQIETFWVNAELDVFFGGLDVTINALLKDGTLYRHVGFPISELDVKASRRLEPKKWSTWRKSGNGFQYSWQNDEDQTSGWRTLEGWRAMRAEPDEVVDAAFEYSGGSARSGSFTYGLRLGGDGRFERSRFSLASTGDSISPDVTPTITRATTSDASGTDVTTSVGSGPVVGATGESATNGNSNTGTYHLAGDVLERTYDDGKTSRVLFLWAREDKSSMILDDTFYYLP